MKSVPPNLAQPENRDQRKFLSKGVSSDAGNKSFLNRLKLKVIMEERESPHRDVLGREKHAHVHFAAGSDENLSPQSQLRGITGPIKSKMKNSNGPCPVSAQNIVSVARPDEMQIFNSRKPAEKYFGKAFCFSDKTIPKHIALTKLTNQENMSSFKRLYTLKSKEATSNDRPFSFYASLAVA